MHLSRTKIGILILTALIVLIGVPIVMRADVSSFIFTSQSAVPQSEAALVLGASVVNGVPSPVLAARADAAVALYKAGKVAKILVTGDNADVSYDEVNAVQRYLLAAGIPGQDIFLDHAGFDTYSSMYRARDIFQVKSVVIVTQDFHLPRALWIAQHLGITAYGYTAPGGTSSPYDYLREIPASWKALFDVLTHRKPEYLGPVIPLTGDGQATW